MRFRVWDNQFNEYVNTKYNPCRIYTDGSLEILCDPPCDDGIACSEWEKNKQERYIIEHSTELTDKIGKEIFAGDIVEWDDGILGSPSIRRAIVELFPALQFRLTQDTPTGRPDYVFRYGNFIYKQTEKYLTIVGNIHDTKENEEIK
jgi:hypothetical protein